MWRVIFLFVCPDSGAALTHQTAGFQYPYQAWGEFEFQRRIPINCSMEEPRLEWNDDELEETEQS